MKSRMWFVGTAVLIGAVILLGRPSVIMAQDRTAGATLERLERLERRVSEMAERQEQMMRRLAAQLEQREQLARQEQERLTSLPAPMAPLMVNRPPGKSASKSLQDTLGLLFLVCVVCNILLSIWIYTDIRKRGEGSGVFVALALLAGIPTAIIYSLVRIGDRKA